MFWEPIVPVALCQVLVARADDAASTGGGIGVKDGARSRQETDKRRGKGTTKGQVKGGQHREERKPKREEPEAYVCHTEKGFLGKGSERSSREEKSNAERPPKKGRFQRDTDEVHSS